jgi:hypothetical protein
MKNILGVPTCEPSPSDSAPVPEGLDGCEGNDCINYDFPFDLRVKGKRSPGEDAS